MSNNSNSTLNILIAGGTGFIGQALVAHLSATHHLTILGRNLDKITSTFSDSKFEPLTWDALTLEHIERQDIIINLCGLGVADKSWSEKRKQELLDSRIIPTQKLAQLCAESTRKPALFNASAIGTYGLQESQPDTVPPALDETTTIDFSAEPDFLATIGRRWENATQIAKDAGVRVVICRFGVVLGKEGGIVKKLKLPYLCCLGGPIGDGMQPFSWIALQDIVSAIEFLMSRDDISGPVNIVSPNTVTQMEFASTFAHLLNRPAFFPMVPFIVKSIFGQMGEEALLKGQHVYPKVLLENGYVFRFSALNDALSQAIK